MADAKHRRPIKNCGRRPPVATFSHKGRREGNAAAGRMRGQRAPPSTALQSRARSVFAMAMTVELSAPDQADAMASRAPSGRLRRYARPALGLLLPVGLALAWEIIVRLGFSTG